MKTIQNKKKNKKIIIVASALTGLLLAGGVAYAARNYFSAPQASVETQAEDRTIDLSPPTTEQQDAGNDAKEDFIDRLDEEDNGSDTSSVSISISSSGQSDQTYQMRTIINTIDDTGTCTLTMKSAGQQEITQSVGTQSMGSYSVCKGFDVPASSLGQNTWSTEIKYANQSVTATAKMDVKL